MYSTYYKQIAAALMSLPIVALVLFLVVFVALVVRAVTRPRAELDRAARLPLGDDHETHDPSLP